MKLAIKNGQPGSLSGSLAACLAVWQSWQKRLAKQSACRDLTRLSTAIKCLRRAEAEAAVEADTEAAAAAGANPVSSQRNLCPGTDMPCHSSISLTAPSSSSGCLSVRAEQRKAKRKKEPAIVALYQLLTAQFITIRMCVCECVCIAYTAAYKVEVVNQNLNLTHAATANGSSLALHRHKKKKKERIHPLLCLPFVCLIFVRDCPASAPLPHSPPLPVLLLA